MHGGRLQPDLITINTAISACAKGERAKDAKRLIRSESHSVFLNLNLLGY